MTKTTMLHFVDGDFVEREAPDWWRPVAEIAEGESIGKALDAAGLRRIGQLGDVGTNGVELLRRPYEPEWIVAFTIAGMVIFVAVPTDADLLRLTPTLLAFERDHAHAQTAESMVEIANIFRALVTDHFGVGLTLDGRSRQEAIRENLDVMRRMGQQ